MPAGPTLTAGDVVHLTGGKRRAIVQHVYRKGFKVGHVRLDRPLGGFTIHPQEALCPVKAHPPPVIPGAVPIALAGRLIAAMAPRTPAGSTPTD